ncbi:MAG: PAS domain S-box protein [Patescibacteria group bacterium]
MKKNITQPHTTVAADAALAYANSIIDTLREPFLVLDANLKVVSVNPSFLRRFKLTKGGALGKSLVALDGGHFKSSKLLHLLRSVLPKKSWIEDFEFSVRRGGADSFVFSANARQLIVPKEMISSTVQKSSQVKGKLILLAIEDVTERKRIEEKVNISELRYRRLFEAAQDGVLILDAYTGKIVDANPFLTQLIGFTRNEVVDKKVWEIGAVKNIKESKVAFRQLQKKNYIRFENLPLQTKDGRLINVEFVSNVYRVDHTKVIQCNIRDITDRRRAELALKSSEERYRSIFDEGTVGMVIADRKLNFTKVNRKFCKMLGYTEKEMLGMTFKDITHPDNMMQDVKNIGLMLQGKKASYQTQKRYIRKDGGTIWANTHVNFIHGIDRNADFFQSMIEDVTREKLAVDALQKNETKYRGLYDSIRDGIVRFDLQGNFLECNRTFQKMLGYTGEELKKMSYYQFTLEKNRALQDSRLKDQILKRGYADVYEETFVRKDSSTFPGESMVWLVRDHLGRPESIWGITRDISKTKQSERALEASEAKYRGLYDSIRDGIEMTDVHGRFIESNKAYQDMLGYTDKELKRLTYHQITPEKWQAMELEILSNQLIKNGFSGEYEKEYIRKDGTVFPVACRLWMIKDEKGHPIGSWGIVRDITDRKKVEHLKEDFSSLASHQLRTPLTGTKWLVESMLEERSGQLTPKQKESLNNIYQTNEKMINLVNDMLNIIHLESGKTAFELKPVAVCDVIDGLMGMLKTSADQRQVKITVDCGRLREPKLTADPKQLQTILECLVSNAIEYSPAGKEVLVEVVEEPEDVVFIVKDSGIGIPKDEQQKIFERFYRATNAKSQKTNGTGLGLAIAQMLAKEMGGGITFKSEEGKGSDFFLRLPRRGHQKKD